MKFLTKLFSTGAKELLSTAFDGIDKLTTTKEEKAALRSQVLQQVIGDRKDAREMYKNDSWLQKIFALFFLLAWGALTWFLLQHFAFKTINLEEWQIGFIGTIYGAINTKLGTIIDFLFGGSHKSDITKK